MDFTNSLGPYPDPYPYSMQCPPLRTEPPPAEQMGHTFNHFGDDAAFAAALANYQPCHDCTPATKSSIPHHHHPPGRLAGASATLDGHFCCSWLVHPDQPCYLCFDSAEALDNHIKSDHAGKDGTYRCHWQNCAKLPISNPGIPTVPINFTNKPKLMRHVHSHTGYKPFPCPFPGCEKGFVTKEQLKNHETTHTKARKYVCDSCGKAFAVKSALTTHVQAVHKEEKTHKCDVCGKAFADSSNLSKHKQTHWRGSANGTTSNGVRKQRSRRGTESAASSRSTPSISTPLLAPTTPHTFDVISSIRPPAHAASSYMLTPCLPKLAPHASCNALPSTDCCVPAPCAPTTFDPNCYCCDQACPPPPGPVTPCESPEECGLEGFCDLPECLGQQESCEAGMACPDAAIAAYCCAEPVCTGGMEVAWEELQGWEWDEGGDALGEDL